MKPGDRVEVRNWKAHGWEGRSGIVFKISKTEVWVRFNDWSPTDVCWPLKDADCLIVVG